MSEISLYTGSHTDLAHVREFFEKQLLQQGEEALAVFDGVFYEAKNERVGGLAFHDYLVFSDKAVYLWARGVQKDYLDRFNLGAVSFRSKETEEDFSTVDLTIQRAEGKDPIYLIFDLVPKNEAAKLMQLHTALELALESGVGKNFLGDIPSDTAKVLRQTSLELLPTKKFNFAAEPAPNDGMPMNGQAFPPEILLALQQLQALQMQQMQQNGGASPILDGNGNDGGAGMEQPFNQEPQQPQDIFMSENTVFYGDSVLDKLKRVRYGAPPPMQQFGQQGYGQNGFAQGFSAEFLQNEPRPQFFQNPMAAMQNPFSSLQKIDKVSLKRAEAITKDLINSIPEEYREQAKKDFKEMPERMSQALNALNELLGNIAESPQAQSFIVQTVGTAVKNDGLFGSMMKLANIFGQTATKAAKAGKEQFDTMKDEFNAPAKDSTASAKSNPSEPITINVASSETEVPKQNETKQTLADTSGSPRERKKIKIRIE
jgi:hypothetical protein